MADDEADHTGDIVDAEFTHQVRAVVLDRLGADVEFHGHFLARETLGQQDRDFFFAFRERRALGVDVAFGGGEGVGHGFLEGFAEPGIAGGDGVDCLAEFGEAGALRDIATDANLEEPAGELLLGLSGEDQDLQVGLRAVELAEDFQSADARQEDVEDQDVGLKLFREREAFVAVGRRAQDAIGTTDLEHLNDQLADGGLVFHDHDRFRLPGSCLHGGVPTILSSFPPQANAKGRPLVTILFRRGVDESLPDHEADQSGHVPDAELAHQVGPMVLGGLDTDVQVVGDLLAAMAFGDEHRDLAFPGGQLIDYAFDEVGGGGEGEADRAAEIFGEPSITEGDGLERLAEFGERAVLVHEAVDAGLHEGADDMRLLLAGEDQHLHRGEAAPETAKDFDTADARHDDIEDQDVRPQLQRKFHGAQPLGGRADRDATGVGVHHLRHQVADRGLVLDHQHALFAFGRGRSGGFLQECRFCQAGG